MKLNEKELRQFEALVKARKSAAKPVSTLNITQLIEQRRKNLARKHD